MVNITSAAHSLITAYTAAISLGASPSANLTAVAEAMTSLYLPSFTSFTLGSVTQTSNTTLSIAGIASYLQRWNSSGLGTDFRNAGFRIEPVSDQSALCWITWRLVPPETSSVEPFEFVDLYGFRIAEMNRTDVLGGWELSVADNEIEAVLARVPGFFG